MIKHLLFAIQLLFGFCHLDIFALQIKHFYSENID